jgi:pimeloyl-ACP methyl ester carboxylesterase
MSKEEITVVLTHGAWADGSSWARVITGLQVRGQRAIAAQLPLTAFEDDVAALNRMIRHVDGPVVLVGYAYGGAVIGAAQPGKVLGLAYVAAFVPDEGETVADVFFRTEPHPKAPKLAPDADGFLWMPETAFADAVSPDASAAHNAVLAAVQKPVALAAITTPMRRPLWRDLPSWYLLAENDLMVSADNQRFMAGRMGATVVSHPVDHAPQLSHPDLVVQFIVDAVRGSSAPKK